MKRSAPKLVAEPEPQPGLDRQIQGRLGDHLRALYDGMIQQPVPDRFRDLIDKLDAQPKLGES